VCRETAALAKRWPRAGNPALTYGPTGELADSINYRVRESANPSGIVGTDKRYALVVHDGGQERWISVRNKTWMRFRWKRFGGKIFYFKKIRHPATKGSHFLTEPLRVVAARHGFVVRATTTR